MRGPRLRVGTAGQSAGVQVFPPAKWATEGPYAVTRIVLVVDGAIVDLNRIPLPADTSIIDERFPDDAKAAGGAKGGGAKGEGAKAADPAGGGVPAAEPRPAATPGDAAGPKR